MNPSLAARCDATKHITVSRNRNLNPTAPLFPCRRRSQFMSPLSLRAISYHDTHNTDADRTCGDFGDIWTVSFTNKSQNQHADQLSWCKLQRISDASAYRVAFTLTYDPALVLRPSRIAEVQRSSRAVDVEYNKAPVLKSNSWNPNTNISGSCKLIEFDVLERLSQTHERMEDVGVFPFTLNVPTRSLRKWLIRQKKK